jgi:hypothetical protein
MIINPMMKNLNPMHYRKPARPRISVFDNDSDGGGKKII